MFGKILQFIVEQTIPARLRKPWDFLDPVPSVRTLESEPSALVASLLGAFPEDELLAAQILLPAPDGKHRLTPVVDANIPFKVLSRQKDEAPCDFEHEQGRLTAGDPAALRCLDDHRTSEQCAKRKWVLATFSNLDLAVLTMLGLPATPACGLSSITAEQARRFLTPAEKTIGVPAQPDGPTQLPVEPPKIILVANELFTRRNKMPAGSLHAATQFQRIERTMKLDTASRIGIWRPSPADFRLIRDGVALADRQLVRNAIKNSVQSSESIQQYFKSTSALVVDDVPRARRKLLDKLASLSTSTLGVRDLPVQLEALNRAYENALLERTFHQAMATADTIGAGLWFAAAELLEMQFEASNIVQRTRAAIAARRAENVDTTLDERLRLQLRLAEGLIRIKKSLEINN